MKKNIVTATKTTPDNKKQQHTEKDFLTIKNIVFGKNIIQETNKNVIKFKRRSSEEDYAVIEVEEGGRVVMDCDLRKGRDLENYM